MQHNIKSMRPFIGAKDFKLSRSFYSDLGFKEVILSSNLSVFKSGEFAFYLQDAYVKDWVDNSMVFLEVADVNRFWEELLSSTIAAKYPTVKLVPIKEYDWGRECFIHDPSGILWHIGQFSN